MDWHSLEEKATRGTPEQPLKVNRCLIAVQQPLGELDFVRMMEAPNVRLKRVDQQYETSVDFSRDGVKYRDETLNSIVGDDGSNVIVFRAILTGGTCPSAGRPAPLEVLQASRDTSQSIETTLVAHDANPLHIPTADQDHLHMSTQGSSKSTTQEGTMVPSTEPENASEHGHGDFPNHDNQDGRAVSYQVPVRSAVTPANLAQPVNARLAHSVAESTVVKAGPSLSSHTPSRPLFHEEEPSSSFNDGNFLKPESFPPQDSQGGEMPTDDFIRKIINQESPNVLEAGMRQGIEILKDLRQAFSTNGDSSPDAQAYVDSIDKLIPQAKQKRTVIGVVGNTGAGKSSVINALLEEERLVPTSCMRACTAVVTEISWNDSTDPFSKYRAEVEFMSKADWEKEVATLMKEFLTESGSLIREASDQNTDAGVAWAKFHAVHPKIARDKLGDCTMAQLMSEEGLNALGTTQHISSSSAKEFYQQLQKFVDNKGKIDKTEPQMEYWPLIKVVKIYTKASALSTGAVVVDLPGIQDSNAARSAVAQSYIRQCNGLWIVAPITRAVDDKAAKTLLGDAFKMQLKYDGGLSNVTFICSKTDDISVTETIDALGLEDEVETLNRQKDELAQEIIEQKQMIQDLTPKRQHDSGMIVDASVPRTVKRKKQSHAEEPRHKRQIVDKDSDAGFISDDDNGASETEDDDDDDEKVQAPRVPLTENETEERPRELRATKRTAKRELQDIDSREALRAQIRTAKARTKAIEAKVTRICISGRNEYSKAAIQNDFAAGIKELDHENAAEEDEDTFNPDEEQQDYDQVARSLPVFCVSSRAYQKMCRRLKKDGEVTGFVTPEDTEVPQLQKHCEKLTEAGRVQTCRNFLLSVCQLLTNFALWASMGRELTMTEKQKIEQAQYVSGTLVQLEENFEVCVQACLDTIRREMENQIFDKYSALIRKAVDRAPDTVAAWGAHRDDGGLGWATYKAIVRRDGVYHSRAGGYHDFNSELVKPITKRIAPGWERTFQHRLPKVFATFTADSGNILRKIHQAVEQRVQRNGVGRAGLYQLQTQINTYERMFDKLNQDLVDSMTVYQRLANRDFASTISRAMQDAYDACTDESGRGSFKRMKDTMSAYVAHSRNHMFGEAALNVKNRLDDMCGALEKLMQHQVRKICANMKADYMHVLVGIQEAAPVRRERALRSVIMNKLRAVDAQFEAIAGGEVVVVDEAKMDAAAAEDPATQDADMVDSDSDGIHLVQTT
ncbi:hypothetical protein OPT61_g5104 [Boeremia exigua]|uniref:Uncharacterized protein n=1 Tax=Boeremia exigua TaxID=749465 RepID=A0ACC2IBG3_9PLEO|nr:hypothetical protein OPT61_g5104 [Boeremia exigua]